MTDQDDELRAGPQVQEFAGLRDVIERTLLVGLGAAALTVDRAQKVVDDFVRRGQLSAEEGRDMVEGLASRSRDEARSVLKSADSSVQSVFRELGIASRRELEDIDFRLRQIEHRLTLLERDADSPPDQ
ncbi:MAG: phasin family protein [Thermoleophilia bacterium]